MPQFIQNLLPLLHSAQDDYISREPFQITFPPGSRRNEYNITIVDDQVPEDTEYFNAYVSQASQEPVMLGSPRQPLIMILELVDGEYLYIRTVAIHIQM